MRGCCAASDGKEQETRTFPDRAARDLFFAPAAHRSGVTLAWRGIHLQSYLSGGSAGRQRLAMLRKRAESSFWTGRKTGFPMLGSKTGAVCRKTHGNVLYGGLKKQYKEDRDGIWKTFVSSQEKEGTVSGGNGGKAWGKPADDFLVGNRGFT